ncbi:SNF2 helicase-associated domain-containing protein [Nonomuraea thailandensis]
MSSSTDLVRHSAVFQPGDPPRSGQIAFLDPGGDGLVTVAEEQDGQVTARSAAATLVPVGEAVAALARARTDPHAHPAARFWGAAALVALQLVTRGRILPGVTAGEHDSWRAGPLDAEDLRRVRELAAAMPAAARAVPRDTRPHPDGPLLPDAEPLVRAFLDAVADAMPRSPGAVRATGLTAFAAARPVKVPHLRRWSEEVSAGLDAGVRLSLRVEADDPASAEFRAVVQLHSLADPSLVVDAADLWHGRDPGFGARARIEATLAVRRAARAWPRLERLLDSAVPDELTLSDGDVEDLLAGAADRLAAAGVDVHWPRSLVRGLSARAVLGDRDAAPSDMPSFLGGQHLTSFDWQLALGGERLTAAEMDRLAEAHRPVVRLRDQWVLIDPDLARKARQRDLKPLTGIEALGAALTGTVEVEGEQVPVEPTAWLEELRERLAEPAAVDPPRAWPPPCATTSSPGCAGWPG